MLKTAIFSNLLPMIEICIAQQTKFLDHIRHSIEVGAGETEPLS
jgi:hypothetical protein